MSDNKVFVFSNEAYRGVKGRVIAALMNAMHSGVHAWFADRIGVSGAAAVLDVGCGGGGLIRAMLARTNGRVYGLDYSADMTAISKRNNKKAVLDDRAQIVTASVSHIPYAKNTFDIVTAFETIQFWPDAAGDLKEIIRILKPGGTFHIMNRMPKPSSKWYDRLPIKTAADYCNVLQTVGFNTIDSDTNSKKGWIVICASV